MSTIKTTNITHGSNSGTANMVLASDGKVTVPTKKLVCPGTILNVGHVTTTNTFSESVSAGAFSSNNVLNLNYTATSTSNRLLFTINLNVGNNNGNRHVGMALYADGSVVTEAIGAASGSKNRVTAMALVDYDSNLQSCNAQAWVTPASTNSINYSIRLCNLHDATNTLTANASAAESDTTQYGRPISSMTIMEISQ